MDLGYDHYNIGMELLESGKFTEAMQSFKASLSLQSHFKTYERLYDCCKQLGYNEEAFQYIGFAFANNGANDKVAYAYASELSERGRSKEAAEILSGVLSRNPSYKKARELLTRLQA